MSRSALFLSACIAAAAALFPIASLAAPNPAPLDIRVSENRRYLVTGSGQPFFYLADTAWELFHRASREDAEKYLTQRAGLGFTVIQAVALAEMDGLNTPNVYGHRPLIDNDPARPDVKVGPENDYWDHVDFIVERANSLGLVVGLLPTWGDKWNKKWGVGPEVFTPENARSYGRWLGRRYAGRAVIWIVGGDRPIENDTQLAILRQLAEGLHEGDSGRHLITFHPSGGSGSADRLHEEPWLDFNMRQNGHGLDYTDRYSKTLDDYRREPVKPVLDGEPIYEDHPVAFAADKQGHSLAADVRRALYWDLFSGACGHTYGHHSVWQLAAEGVPLTNAPLMSWNEALLQPGAAQMRFAKDLLLSRPYLTRIPDDSLLVPTDPPTSIPGAGTRRFVATRDENGSYAMIYAPVGRKFTVNLEKLTGANLAAWWYNPRDGRAEKFATIPRQGAYDFTPPNPGEALDWVLILDDVSRGYPPPGNVR